MHYLSLHNTGEYYVACRSLTTISVLIYTQLRQRRLFSTLQLDSLLSSIWNLRKEMVQHPSLRKALQREKALFITTYDANGKPGTVEVWYVFHREKVYIYTGRGSLKARKIAVDPRVKLALGTRSGPALHGRAEICEDHAIIRRIAESLAQKYDNYWGSVEALAQEMLPGASGVLLEIGELTAAEESGGPWVWSIDE